jgi:hypothetical protein
MYLAPSERYLEHFSNYVTTSSMLFCWIENLRVLTGYQSEDRLSSVSSNLSVFSDLSNFAGMYIVSLHYHRSQNKLNYSFRGTGLVLVDIEIYRVSTWTAGSNTN